MAFRRRNQFKFTERTQSKKGIISLCTAGFLIILFAAIIYAAYRAGGKLSVYYGSIGILAVLAVLVNAVVSFQSMREENSYQLIPHLAFIVNLLAAVCWLGTLFLGLH